MTRQEYFHLKSTCPHGFLLEVIGQGLSVQEMADVLRIPEKTARNKVSDILHHFGVHNRLRLVHIITLYEDRTHQ